MVGYRCYILDAEDHILQAHDIDFETDEQATTGAERLLTLDPYHCSVEVWQATQRIARLERDAARRQLVWRPPARTTKSLGSVT